jgi:hypothetical protein
MMSASSEDVALSFVVHEKSAQTLVELLHKHLIPEAGGDEVRHIFSYLCAHAHFSMCKTCILARPGQWGFQKESNLGCAGSLKKCLFPGPLCNVHLS